MKMARITPFNFLVFCSPCLIYPHSIPEKEKRDISKSIEKVYGPVSFIFDSESVSSFRKTVISYVTCDSAMLNDLLRAAASSLCD